MSETPSLKGKVAIVTGSGRGIGAGIARGFAQAGAAVVITGRTAAEIEATAAEIREAGGRAIAVTVDVTDLAKLSDLVDRTVAEFGGVDIVVNNAGGARSPAFVDTRPEHLESLFRLQVSAPFELVRLALPHLLKRPGASVINILSPGSYKATRGNLAYYVAKAGLQHLTKLMAADLGPKVRVNAIIPGPIETPALKKMIAERPEVRDAALRSIQMRRMGQPEDVAAAALFLASPAASFITGALLPVTGGEVEGSPGTPDL